MPSPKTNKRTRQSKKESAPISGSLAKPFTIVQVVLMDETGDSYYRMRWPGAHLARQAPGWRVINVDCQAVERLRWAEEADLLVLYQTHDPELHPVITRRAQRGLKTLVEYNDNYYAPPPSSPVAEAWRSPILWRAYERFMKRADGVIVTCKALQEVLQPYFSAPSFILENHLPELPPPFEHAWHTAKKGVSIGLAGSIGHAADFWWIAEVLRDIAASYPDVTIHIMGNEALPDLLALPPERLRFVPWGPMEAYFQFWEHCNIGIAPLLDTAYNQCRSDVKAIEMASRAVVPVLTRRPCYDAFIEQTNVPSFSTRDELRAVLTKLLDDRRSLKPIARSVYDFVTNQRLGDNRHERFELYSRFLPQVPGNFPWPQTPGYHEVHGTPQQATVRLRAEESVAATRERGAPPGTTRLLSLAVQDNPDDPDLALRFLQLRRSEPKFLELLESEHARFPDDPRFGLLALSSHGSDAGRWQRLMAGLASLRPEQRDTFEIQTGTLFLTSLAKYPELSGLIEELVALFPNHTGLRNAAAIDAKHRGDRETAREHTEWLLALERYQRIKPSALERPYLETLLLSLSD